MAFSIPFASSQKKTLPLRIGAVVGPHDPFWVQTREAVYQRIEQIGATLIPLEISESTESLYSMDSASLAEELLSHELDAIVSQTIPAETIYQVVCNGLPVIHLGESDLRHPLFCSPYGLYQAAQMAAEWIAEKLKGRGRILCVGGLLDRGDDKGITRIRGFMDTLARHPEMVVLHCPTAWRYDQAYPLVISFLSEHSPPIDAVFGLSDSLALAGRDAGRALGIVTPDTLIVGINGDPLALAAIANGTYHATVETSPMEMGRIAVELAVRAAQSEPLPQHYDYPMRLITAENVQEFALEKLISIANLPTYLVGVNREQERNRLIQLETSAAINQRVGALLDRRQLSREIADLIRGNYGFDHVQLFLWSEQEQCLYLDSESPAPKRAGIRLEDAGLLGEVIRRNDAIFIPDTRHSHRYLPDPKWPETRSRVILPIRLGGKILGLLDLHSRKPILNLRWEMIGLQLLADQFGIALRNAELYSDALRAREVAERADQLKTRLLANVSHELRAPLNVILGYSQSALSISDLYGIQLPEELRQDLRYIYQSGEHLIRIINDLLDLSRAEIGELNVFPEAIDIKPFLEDVFRGMESSQAAAGDRHNKITWKLELPRRLPVIQADPDRLRQILLNLLSNASKFTTSGQILLGAEVEPPYLHLWVSDSGSGIPVEQQERIFEPFFTGEGANRRKEGVGLGLTITRRLVALHGGSMSLESLPGQGSTFHVYLPLPNLSGQVTAVRDMGSQPVLLLLAPSAPIENFTPPSDVAAVAARLGMEIRVVRSINDLNDLLHEIQPAALAWDTSAAQTGDLNFIHRVRSNSLLASLPFMLYRTHSTAGQNGFEGGGSSSGLTNLLVKPFSGKTLLELIDGMVLPSSTGPVLIVDDDPQARALYQRLTQEAIPGVCVRLADDGKSALALLEEETPSLVILDLMMPNVDGFQVLDYIRSTERTCRVPVIVMSGKVLTMEDVARLDFAGVVLQSKDMITSEEALQTIQRAFAGDMKLGQSTSLLVKMALAYLYQNYTQPISRSDIAEAVGVSEAYLSQIFSQEIGISPLECLNRLRIQRAREMLRSTGESVTNIAAKVGFDDPAYFSRVFRKLNGCSPLAYRKGNVSKNKLPDC